VMSYQCEAVGIPVLVAAEIKVFSMQQIEPSQEDDRIRI